MDSKESIKWKDGKTYSLIKLEISSASHAQERIKKLMERGFHKPGDVEDRLGYHVGQLGR